MEIDYRDKLAKAISEKYSSMYKFCKATGMDEGFLSQVLNKKKHLSIKTLTEILENIGYELTIVAKK